jgi:hypothetical protein
VVLTGGHHRRLQRLRLPRLERYSLDGGPPLVDSGSGRCDFNITAFATSAAAHAGSSSSSPSSSSSWTCDDPLSSVTSLAQAVRAVDSAHNRTVLVVAFLRMQSLQDVLQESASLALLRSLPLLPPALASEFTRKTHVMLVPANPPYSVLCDSSPSASSPAEVTSALAALPSAIAASEGFIMDAASDALVATYPVNARYRLVTTMPRAAALAGITRMQASMPREWR